MHIYKKVHFGKGVTFPMKTTDALYRHTLVRVGPDAMRGIDRLLSEGHHGIAERHTVGKLVEYMKELEHRLGIHVPNPDKDTKAEGYIRSVQNGVTYFIPR